MKTADAVTVGAVDIGSNTVHLVVARTDGIEIEILDDQKEMARLGDDVSYHGEISPTKFDLTLRLLKQYQQISRARRAHFIVFGTEPLRAARNSARLVQHARAEMGINVHVLSQPEEAVLSFRGATHGMLLPSHFIMADIGGGSTEIVIVNFHQIESIISLPVGSIKLRAMSEAGDPLTQTQIRNAQFRLGEIFGATHWPRLPLGPNYGIFAGGNAKAITRLFNRGRRGEILRTTDLWQSVNLAASKSSELIAQEYNLVPSRAQTFGTGALIINAIMEKFKLETGVVSRYGIREGMLLSFAQYHEGWRDSLRA
jgi:exopolyphosphatase/guanosine-5'-triphosphate,3'-diphosphate pyrophosphatase